MFKVVKAGAPGNLFYTRGSRDEVYGWLKERSTLDAPGFDIIDCATRERFEEGEFLRKYEEESDFLRKYGEEVKPLKKHTCLSAPQIRIVVQEEVSDALVGIIERLSEARIRIIVREEVSKIIDAAREKADVPEYYDTEKMSDALVAIVDHLSEAKANEALGKHEDSEDHSG